MFWSTRAKIRLAGAAAAMTVWVIAAPMLADALLVDRPIAGADAIVVLSGAADYRQRASGAAEAYRNETASKIILTDDHQRGGWDDTEKGNPYFVQRTTAVLVRNGVPLDAIEKLPGKVNSTWDEAEAIVRAARERGFKRVLLVTSDYHSRRALWTIDHVAAAQNADISFGIMRSPSEEGYPSRNFWWVRPRGWRSVAAEYLKFAAYWLFY